MSTFNTKYMFAHNYAAIAHTVPSITFKPNMGYLLEVVESTTDQVVLNDDEAGVVGNIPVNAPVHTETVVLPSAGEKVYSEETDITDEFVPTTSVESYQTNVPYMDDFLGENEGEEDEQDKNASEVESSTEQFILDVCKLSNDSVNTSNKEVITHTASVIARNIGQVYTNLTNELSPEVDELVKQVQLEAESINQLSGTDQLATYLNIDNTKITPINWNELSVLGTPNTIIDNSKRFSGYTGSNLLTFNAAKAIVTKWSNQIPSTTISKEVKDNIINMIACTLDGKKVPYLYDETDNQQIPDTIEELDTISDNSETAAEESFKNFYDSYARNGIAQEGLLSDLKTKLKDLFTSTDTFVDQIKKVNLSKYSKVKPEDLPNNKVVLLNKKFASELYTILNRNYMQVDKVVKLLLDTPVAATRAQVDTIINMCNKLAKDLPGYSRESSNIKQLLKTNSSEKTVKDSDWKLGDIRIMDKIEELSNRYKTIEDKASSDAMWDRFSGMDATDDLINCGFVIEYYMYYTAVLRSQLAKTCIRIIRAYDKALESTTSGTENLDLVSGEEGFSDILRKLKSFFGGIETKYNQVKKLDFDKYADIKIKDLPGKGVQIDLNLMKNIIKFYNSHPFDPQILNDDYKKLHEEPKQIVQKYTKQYIEPLMKVFSISSFDIKHTNLGKFKKLNIQSDVYENNKYTVRDLISVIKELDVLFELFVTKCTTIINSLPHKSDYDLGILVWIFIFWPAAIPLIIARSHAEDDINVVNASKQIASAMNSYFKFGVAAFAGILDMSDDIYSKLAKVKATESILPYMDDFLGENEGEEDEQEKNASEVSASVASEVYNIVATSIGYERFVKYLNHVIQGRDTGKQVQPLMDIVTKYPKVLDLYRTMDLNISHTDNEIIRKNTETVMDVLNTVGLYLLTCRKYFKDNNVLVLDANHVNSDTLVDFEKQGGSMEDISRHILHKYTLMNTSLPFVGLRTSEVLSNKQAVASEHFRRCDATKKSIELKEGGALVLAYTKVLSKYLEMTPSSKLPIGMSMNNFITNNKVIITRTSNHLRDSKISVDSCIYRFMLDLWYHDKPIYKQMYNKFENKYRQLFNSSMGDITPEQKLQADAEVLSDTVLEFLMDNLVTSK